MEYYFNYEKLVNEIMQKGFTIGNFAERMSMSEQLCLLKLCNQEEFTMEEIRVITEEILEIPPEKISEYFFAAIDDK